MLMILMHRKKRMNCKNIFWYGTQDHTCETELYLVLATWKEDIDKQHTNNIVFLDFKRSFETIDSGTLLTQPMRIEFAVSVLTFVRLELNNAKQIVQLHIQNVI